MIVQRDPYSEICRQYGISRAELLGAIDETLTEAELMGEDIDDPELMGGFFKRVIGKIRDRIRARRAARQAAPTPAPAEPESYAVSTPYGQVRYDQGGLQVIRPQQATAVPQTGSSNMLYQLTSNPMMLMIPLGLVAMLLMNRK